MKKNGRPSYHEPLYQMGINLPVRQHDWLYMRSKKMGISRSELVRRLIEREINNPTIGIAR